MPRKRVAIVGSGCSGIAALWALQSTDHEVHLYESASRLGGHTNTVTFEGPDGQYTNVDTGFIVLNTATYRQYTASSDSLLSSSQSWSQQTLSLF
jgi:predicted NAD/FAD-binding protein